MSSCDESDNLCVVQNCSGYIGGGNILFNYWNTHNCPSAYAQFITTGPDNILEYNPVNQKEAQDYVNNLFDVYLSTNKLTDNVTADYNPFQNTLLDLCLDPRLPGICGQFLTGYCGGYTRDKVINSPVLINFCGCYTTPDPVYLTYTMGSAECVTGGSGCTAGCMAGDPGCTGQPACDPLCHRALTSQKAYDPTGNIITCPQNICVIDNITINAYETQVPGGINFNTVCPACGGSSGGDGCLCIVSGVNISSTMSNIGVGSNFNFFCGSSSVCLLEDSSGNITQTGCTGINPNQITIPSFPVHPNYAIIIIIGFILLIILFVAIATQYSSQKVHLITI